MDSADILWNARLTRRLVRDRVFSSDPFILIDVGMRGGVQQYWTMLRDQMRVIGFEPDQSACTAINSTATEWQQECHPLFLDREPRQRALFARNHNHAANGLHMARRNGSRFIVGAGTTSDIGLDAPSEHHEATVVTTTYDLVATKLGFPRPDFVKIDVEGAELDVLKGARSALGVDGAIGVEVEARFSPDIDAPDFAAVHQHLSALGYAAYNMSLGRQSRGALPLELAGDHRNHLGEPIYGPTARGQLTHGDAVYFRDLIGDRFVPVDDAGARRILKAAAAFEVFNLPDCAAELLIHYRAALSDLVAVDKYLAQLVPEMFWLPMSYRQYVDLYRRQIGRIGSTSTLGGAVRPIFHRLINSRYFPRGLRTWLGDLVRYARSTPSAPIADTPTQSRPRRATSP